MKGLVVVAHGSRREASNQEVRLLSGLMHERLKPLYPLMNTGFLELAEPLIPESIIQCIEQGATEICVLPYFLSAGRHVQEDIPFEVRKVQQAYPEIKISLLSYVGGLPGLLDIMCEYAEERLDQI